MPGQRIFWKFKSQIFCSHNKTRFTQRDREQAREQDDNDDQSTTEDDSKQHHAERSHLHDRKPVLVRIL